jgi:hypothetical protein
MLLCAFTVSSGTKSGSCSDGGTQTIHITGSWVGGSNDWNTANNWCGGVPTSSTNIIIPNLANDPVISETTSGNCNNINIASGATITVESNSTNSGSLIVSGSVSGGGSSEDYITYNRDLNAATNRWWIVSSPVNVTTGFGTVNSSKIYYDDDYSSCDFAWYKESNNDGWQYYETLPSDLTNGQGYLIGMDPEKDEIVSFTGTLNNGNVSISVDNTGTRNGWNALGNPYTSTIGITTDAGTTEKFLTKNSSILETNYAAIYVWNETGGYDGSQQYYKAISNIGYHAAYGMGTLDDDYVQVGQGFLINAGGSGGTIQFTKAMQTHNTTLTLKSAQTSWPGVTLLAENGNQTRYAVVAFHEDMTTGLDKTYDAGLLSSSDFNLYTRLVSDDEGIDFELQALPDNIYNELSVPIGLDLPQAGTVTFKAAGIILPDGIYPILEDKQLQVMTPLKTESDSYSVTFDNATHGTGRFYMRFSNATSADEFVQPESFKAWFANDKIVLDGYAEKGTRVSLFDMTGRKMAVYRLLQMNRNEIPASGLSQGVYLLRIESRQQRQEIKIPVVF